MLQTIRERAQGWFAWAIVILIAIPFAFWGIDSYLGGGGEPAVATVNGQEITQRELEMQLQNYRGQLRERLGAAYRPELIDDAKLRQDVLDNLVRELVLAQTSVNLGLAASKREIRNVIRAEPAFQQGGQFDKAAYERAVQLQGLSSRQFEDRLRQRLISTQLSRLVAASELITDGELAEAVQLLRQQRALSYLTLPADRFKTDAPVAEAEVVAYYDTHQDDFRTPEQVRVAYLLLDTDSLTAGGPTEEELHVLYEKEAERFRQPEQRSVAHILIEVPRGADEIVQGAARQRAEQILARLQQGEDFATLAKELSDDPGSAGQGGNLGTIERGMMDQAFEGAAFALSEGALSEPVRSAFGYHILRVDRIFPEQVKPFEALRAELTAEAQKKRMEGKYFELAERLANLTYEHPDSLEPAAQALNLKIQESDWLSRKGGSGVLANPKVMAAAFAPDILGQGNNSELIEPERDLMQAIVLRVIEHREAAMRPIAQVRPEIEDAIRKEQEQAAAQKAANALLTRLREGQPLGEVAGGYPITSPGLVGRDDAKVPQPIRTLAFTLPRPNDRPSFGETRLDNGDAVVVEVTEVKDGMLDNLTPEAKEQERQRLARALGRQTYDHLVTDLVARAKVTHTSVVRTGENP